MPRPVDMVLCGSHQYHTSPIYIVPCTIQHVRKQQVDMFESSHINQEVRLYKHIMYSTCTIPVLQVYFVTGALSSKPAQLVYTDVHRR